MNKGIVMGALGGLVFGGASGYFVADSGDSGSGKTTTLTESIVNSQRPPRFGVSSSTPSPVHAETAKPRAANVEEVLKERNSLKRVAALMEYYNSLTPEQLMLEARKLSSLSWEDRMVASKLLFSKWAETSPRQALDFVNKMGFRGGMDRMTVFQSWSAQNPEAAAAYLSENRNSMDRGSYGFVAGEWARLNPEAALAWANTLDGRSKQDALASLFATYAESDPIQAAQKALALGDEALKDSRVLEGIARTWAKQDWDAANAWINGLPVEQQSSARRSALEQLAATDPSRATEEVLKLSSGEERDNSIAGVVRAMAMENPAEAANLLLKSSSDNVSRRSMNDVVSSWVYTDTEAAKNWVNSLPAGSSRDSALTTYAMQTPSRNYQETIEMASGISNERNREWAVSSAVRNWMNDDPAAAKSWLDSSNLSDRTKEMINGTGRSQRMRGMRGMAR